MAVDSRVVHLSETGTADRFGVELDESLVDGTQFRLEYPFRFGPVGRRHLVLERREHVDVFRRQDVRPGREQLAEFDERRPEGQKRLEQDFGAMAVGGVVDLARSTEQQESAAITGVREQQREKLPRDEDESPVRANEDQPGSPRFVSVVVGILVAVLDDVDRRLRRLAFGDRHLEDALFDGDVRLAPARPRERKIDVDEQRPILEVAKLPGRSFSR